MDLIFVNLKKKTMNEYGVSETSTGGAVSLFDNVSERFFRTIW